MNENEVPHDGLVQAEAIGDWFWDVALLGVERHWYVIVVGVISVHSIFTLSFP